MTEALLEAGAILPDGSPDAGQDRMTARRYSHPALPGRTIVRLVGATLGEAEDLSMEFLDFTRSQRPAEVGWARRQALGFPAWALVNDPTNGRHALALVKEMGKLARTAVAKPGNAQDGYQQLATRLGAAAPHFLPTFWEQAGREFLAADNRRVAGTCFTEARRAEQVHGLAVDEDRLREVYLEFAFAGALTAKALAEYAREVGRRRPAPEAYELVRTLAVRRTAGGLAPYTSMVDDLKRLAKAAGLDVEREAESLVQQLLGFPAMIRAHESVWKAYRPILVRLTQREPAVRARLLEILPEPPGWDTDITNVWLELLEATGAVEDLLSATSGVSAIQWLERLMSRPRRDSRDRCERLIRLVGRLAPRLRAEGRPVVLWTGPAYHADLDVLDVCLAEQVPVASDGDIDSFQVRRWMRDTRPGRRDLAAVAADPRCRPALRLGAADALAELHGERTASDAPVPAGLLTERFGAPGLRDVVSEVLAERATRVADGTVLALDDTLRQFAAVWSPTGVAMAPAAFASLANVDVPAILATSLRTGLLEELAWPAYREVAAGKLRLRVGNSWPEIVVHDDQSAHIVGADGATREHVFRFPVDPGQPTGSRPSQTECRLVGGQLRVSWWTAGEPGAYWSADPGTIFESGQMNDHHPWGRKGNGLPLAGGAVTTGDRPWHAGDSRQPGGDYLVVSDGAAYWRCERPAGPKAPGWRWREYDPATGAAGRYSVPSFFEVDLPAGATLVPQLCELRPAPEQFAGSPLGWRDGLVGWRVVRLADGSQVGEAVDGRRVSWRPDGLGIGRRNHHGNLLVAGLRLPGSDTVLPVTGQPRYDAELKLTVWNADGTHPLFRGGMLTHIPPLAWWHALRARDERGSAQLRRVDGATAAELMAVDGSVTEAAELAEAVRANIAARLTEVTDPVLRAGIGTLVASAIRSRRRLDEVPPLVTAAGSAQPQVESTPDDVLQSAWDGLLSNRHHYGPSHPTAEILPQIGAVGQVFAGSRPEPVPVADPRWAQALTGLGAFAVRAAAPITKDSSRAALVSLLSAVADAGLADAGPAVRLLTVAPEKAPARGRTELHRDGDQVTLFLGEVEQGYYGQSQRREYLALQFAPTGSFTPTPGAAIRAEATVTGWRGADRIRAFCRLIGERGPAPWRPERVDDLVEATGMTRAEATLLLAGLPELDGWASGFLTPEQLRGFGLTVAQAGIARAALRALTYAQRIALVDGAMPDDPAQLWERGPDVDAIARRWIALKGVRVAIPEQLVTEAGRFLGRGRVTDVLQGIASPTPGSWLTTDGESSSVDWSGPQMTSRAGTPFDGEYLYAAAVALLWLAYRLPWGDPLRDALPRALELVRERLRNPHLLVGSGVHAAEEPPAVGPALVAGRPYGTSVTHHLAPALLTGPDDPALGFVREYIPAALRVLLSPETAAALATPAGARGEHRDPRTSAPDLVGTVAGHTGLDHDTAGYYLQLLALPDPTDLNVRAWNGWKPAQLKRAQAALVEAGLVVTGKRERAGRGVFLPGAWLSRKSPTLPVEAWKAPLHLFMDGLVTLVTRPTAELFHAAWARVVAGDIPRYLDLEEKA